MLPDVRHPLRLSAWLAPNCAGGKAKAALSDSFVIPEDLQAFQGYLTLIPCVMQELSENMGLIKLNQRLQDPQLPPEWFANIFPRDNPKNMRFSINFFTSIGLGGLTDALREHLAALPRILAEQRAAEAAAQQGMLALTLSPSGVSPKAVSCVNWRVLVAFMVSSRFWCDAVQAKTLTSPSNISFWRLSWQGLVIHAIFRDWKASTTQLVYVSSG